MAAAPNNVIPLRAAPQAKAGPPTLALGSNGAPVIALQKKLAEWGFSPGTPTGTFDAATEEALKALQSKLGVPPTGIYSADTAGAVSRDLQNPASILRANAARLSPLPTALAPVARMAQPGAAAAPAAKAAPAAPAVPWLWLGLAAAGLWFFASKAKGGGSVASLTDGEEVGDDYLDRPDDDGDHGGGGDDEEEEEVEEPLAEVAPAPRPAPPPRPASEPIEVEVTPQEPLAEAKPKKRRRNRKPMDEATKKMLAARKKAARAAKRAAAAAQ